MKAGLLRSTLTQLGDFVAHAKPPDAAAVVSARAVLDTIGVALAGSTEPVSRGVQAVANHEGSGTCVVMGTALRLGPAQAALANGTAAHALDYDDMCFVSLAHPSAPLVPAIVAAGELIGASGRATLDAYVVGFEIEARLGRLMNPRHYDRGWHCTSTLGTIGAAAAVSRLFGLDPGTTAHAFGIAASMACGLKENFGTMVKPLHAGLAARNGVLAALLARQGVDASAAAFDGAQGLLRAMDSEGSDLSGAVHDLATRWEILDTGITVKLYPSCAGTHPTVDAVLELRREHGLDAVRIDRIEVDVDAITPTVLIHDRPATGLEAKFSMPFCVAAAIVFGHVGVETFESELDNEDVRGLMARVSMRVDRTLGTDAPALTQSRVRVYLRSGGVLSRTADGARGYPSRPASASDLETKFLSCASRALPPEQAGRALTALRSIEDLADMRSISSLLTAASATGRGLASRS